MWLDTAAFERIGIHLEPEELEALIEEALVQVVPARRVAKPTRELTAEESAALQRGGMNPDWRRDDATNPTVHTAAAYAALLASSLTVAQTARLLGIDASRIRHRLAERTLYGIREKSGWRLPAFQFTTNGLIPGIERVIPALPPSLHPLAVLGWFTRPNSDLHDDADQTPISPLDWLQTGRNPEPVAQLARGIGLGG
ncbi:MAG TPA: hypothetical protein VFZ25_11610 [Chloroflexota bacterium]|nr:hypothetical protein [Chloroflexota bacterium]